MEKRTSVSLSEELHHRAKLWAVHHKTSLTAMLVKGLEMVMEEAERVPAADKVTAWIEDNFEGGSVEVKSVPTLPGGHRVIDSKGDETLVWYDFMTDEIKQDNLGGSQS